MRRGRCPAGGGFRGVLGLVKAALASLGGFAGLDWPCALRGGPLCRARLRLWSPRVVCEAEVCGERALERWARAAGGGEDVRWRGCRCQRGLEVITRAASRRSGFGR